ncbi:MAG: uroporphyrinogen decarboxylase family protein [Planctomycetota bacterium]|jgi:uroporphyrinogen decarboxylase
MNKRDVVIQALGFQSPRYVPWHVEPTIQCAERLREHLGVDDLSGFFGNHFLNVNSTIGRFEPVDADHVRDVYGVVWDRSIDKDIGTPVGFSLYERAWTMRGMTDLLMDMVERPAFVEEFMDRIVEHNLVQIRKALELGVDCVHFGDDYGMQTGLIMGIDLWRRFIRPRLARMFEPVVAAGKVVSMHSCGRVQELFDDLVEIGLNLFNPFQPEVMDVFGTMGRYRGRLAFHGGMSIQQTLPFGTVEEVRDMAARLVEAGSAGGYVFSPSHDVPYDVPPENMVAMMDVLKAQPGAHG